MTVQRLAAREVRAILAQAGVDHSSLEIKNGSVWASDRQRTVMITGPKSARDAAATVLFGQGLACAPYSDRDYWRPPTGGEQWW